MTLKRRYDEVMEHIRVTGEMQARVLEQLERAGRQRSRRRQLSVAAGFLLLLAGLTVLPGVLNRPEVQPPVDVVSGIEECTDARELGRMLGFSVEEPSELPFPVENRSYLNYWGEMAEVRCQGADQGCTYRKSRGAGDNSGDYEIYSDADTLELDGVTVQLRGSGDGWQLAVWNDGEYSFSLRFDSAVSRDELVGVVEQLIPRAG